MSENLSSGAEIDTDEALHNAGSSSVAAQPRADEALIGRRFAKNLSFAFSSQFLVQVLSIGTGIVIARSLSVSEYGLYNLAVAFPNLFGLFFSLGIDYIVVREIVRHPNLLPQTWRAGAEIRAVSIVASVLIIYVASALVGYDSVERRYILFYAVSIAITSAGDALRSIFQALQRMQYDIFSRGADKTVTAVIIVIAALTLGLHTDLLFLALIIGPLVGLGVAYGLVRRYVPNIHEGGSLSLQARIGLVRQSLPIMVSMIANNFLQQVPGVVLSRMRSHDEMGLFSVGNSLVAPFYIFSAVLTATLLPVITERYTKSPDQFRRFHNRFLLILVGLSALLLGLVIVFSPLVVNIVYGERYVGGVEAVQLNALVIPVILIGTYLNALFIAVGSQKWLLISMFVSLAVAVAASPIAIQQLGYLGAALVTGVAPYVGNLLLLYIAYTRIIPAQRRQSSLPG